jgi:Do/DeqQ family serine protease
MMNRSKSLFLSAIIGGTVAFAVTRFTQQSSIAYNPNFEKLPITLASENGAALSAGIDFTKAAEMSVHAVVHIKCVTNGKTINGNPFGNDPFQSFFFGFQPQFQTPAQQSSGSGVIISEDGYICTNNHVINNADKIEVVLNNNKTYTAEVIGKDPTTDLALIKINEKGLPYINYGNSDEVKIGEWVLAVGNPFNLTSTVTAGIVSAKGRNINAIDGNPSNGQYSIESFIQTDAAVNPGNSGGALVNTNGMLIGINTAIASNTGSYTGYSFAIPVNIVRKVMNDLHDFGNVQRAFLGISIRDIDAKLQEEKRLPLSQGVYIAGLTDGGAAEASGMREGDIITKINGADIKSTPELQEQISRYRPGDEVKVLVNRDGDQKELLMTLRNKNGGTSEIKFASEKNLSIFGASFESISASELKKLKIDNGIKVIKLSSGKLASSGIKEGFIITTIDKKPVTTVNDLAAYIENKTGGVLIEGLYPNGVKGYYGFGL